MFKRLLVISLLLITCTVALCGRNLSATPDADALARFHCNVDWGGGMQVFEAGDCSFISPSGMSVSDRWRTAALNLYSYCYGGCGLYMCGHWDISALLGLQSIASGSLAAPLLFRAGWYPEGTDSDGIFYIAECGPGFNSRLWQNRIIFAGAGVGWRSMLCGTAGLAFLLRLQGVSESPSVLNDPLYGAIEGDALKRNNRLRLALSAGLTISF